MSAYEHLVALRAERIQARIDAKDRGVLKFQNRFDPVPIVFAEALLHEFKHAIYASARALKAIGEPCSRTLEPEFGLNLCPLFRRYCLHPDFFDSPGGPVPPH